MSSRNQGPSPVMPLLTAAAAAAAPQVIRLGKKLVDGARNGADTVGKAKDAVDMASDVKDAVGMESGTIGKVRAAASEVTKRSGGGGGKKKLSHIIEQHIDVAVPKDVAYSQWTQFKDFATIMKAVDAVEQQGRDKIRWRSKIGPARREWLAKITEQKPGERISWRSTGGVQTTGVVTFHRLDRELTRVMVQMEYDPRGLIENIGNLLRVQRRRVWRDLKLYKHFIELRAEATGSSGQRVAKDGAAGPQLAGQRVPPNGKGQNGKGQNGKGSGRQPARQRAS